MSHFSDIGFKVKNTEEFLPLFLSVKDKSTKKEFDRHILYITEDKSGAQIYWYIKKPGFFGKETIIGMTPAFKSTVIQNIKDLKYIPNSEYELEPIFGLWVHNDMNEEYPLIIDTPNFLEIMHTEYLNAEKFSATLFANDFEYYKNIDEFYINYPKKEKFSVPSPGMFIPSGTFTIKENPDFKPHSECWCFGKILKIEKLVNTITNNEFYHFVISTYAAEYDVVVDAKLVPEEPIVGGIIGGSFWICAKLSVG